MTRSRAVTEERRRIGEMATLATRNGNGGNRCITHAKVAAVASQKVAAVAARCHIGAEIMSDEDVTARAAQKARR